MMDGMNPSTLLWEERGWSPDLKDVEHAAEIITTASQELIWILWWESAVVLWLCVQNHSLYSEWREEKLCRRLNERKHSHSPELIQSVWRWKGFWYLATVFQTLTAVDWEKQHIIVFNLIYLNFRMSCRSLSTSRHTVVSQNYLGPYGDRTRDLGVISTTL